ncbi:MAG: hypothetical protein GEV03_07665 [Streptosporangiales bacterium]|nr:hypothetical protein [Streptosporangiales bacterium]
MKRGDGSDVSAKWRLSDLAARVVGGDAGPEELFEAFLAATVFCERPDRPGFLAVGGPGDGIIPVFSSMEELAAYAARRPAYQRTGCDWFSTIGRDLLGLLPDGYDLLLNPASDHALRLRRHAWQRRPTIHVSRSSSVRSGGSS